MPSLLVSVAPILVLIAIILVFSKTPHIILVALTAAILVSAVLFHKYLPNNNQTAVLSNGAASAVMPAFATSSSVGFGNALTTATGFAVIKDGIMSIPGNPLISLSIATAPTFRYYRFIIRDTWHCDRFFCTRLLSNEHCTKLIHRIAVVASAVLTVLPHSGVIITFNNLTGIPLKKVLNMHFGLSMADIL